MVVLPEGEAVHALRVLRLRPGCPMLLMNGKGLSATAELSSESTNHKAVCMVTKVNESIMPSRPIVLYVAPPHTKVFDLILKSAVELGVSRIVPIICRYSVAKPDGKPEAWQNALISAMKQSLNHWLPELSPSTDFASALDSAPDRGFFGATPREGAAREFSANAVDGGDVAVWIGPEGGFDPEEEQALLRKGMTPVTLGQYVLRVETAVPAMLAVCHDRISGDAEQS